MRDEFMRISTTKRNKYPYCPINATLFRGAVLRSRNDLRSLMSTIHPIEIAPKEGPGANNQ